MPAPPEPMGLTDEEIKRIDRRFAIEFAIFWSPIWIYLLLAVLNGWEI